MPDLKPWDALRAARQNARDPRGRLGIPGTVFAKQVGISRSYLGALEAGRRIPSVSMVARLADALGVPAAYLGLPPGATAAPEDAPAPEPATP